jgi:polysaccharide deacetylase 2 family uncharacterized protein YibQ
MARGFLAGAFWGLVVGVVIFLTATLMADRQEPLLPQPSAGGETTPAPDASEFDAVEAQEEPALPEPETAPGGSAEIAEAPAVPAPATEPAPAPAAATVAEPAATATAPDAPAPPAEAPAPEVATAPEAVEAPRTGDAPAPAQPASDAPLVAGTAAPEPAPEPAAPETAEAEIAALPPSVSDSAPDAPPVAEAPRAETPLPQLTDTMPGAEPEAEPEATPEALPEADEAPTVPGTIAAAMPGQRAAPLPGIAEEAQPEPAPAPAEAEAEAEAVPAPEGAGALQAYSVPFEAPADRPILALVLLVPPGTDAATLAAFPVPASFAIDAVAPDAADTARALRAAGHELLLIPALPEGATPADVEVALQANVAAVPEAVAFIDGPDASFQSDRTAVAQVVAAAGASGHGLVTFPRGLNTAQQIARRDGVPAALVFRDFDAEGQSADEIRRILDQAAFRARQEGAVILVGRASPGTLAALTEWALGSRAASVALAPVSAALLAQD